MLWVHPWVLKFRGTIWSNLDVHCMGSGPIQLILIRDAPPYVGYPILLTLVVTATGTWLAQYWLGLSSCHVPAVVCRLPGLYKRSVLRVVAA